MSNLPAAIRDAIKRRTGRASKYRATPTSIDGIRFDSKAEAEFYRYTKTFQPGILLLRQVPFDLPGGVKYRADFALWNERTGGLQFVDIKGVDTPVSKLKRKQVEALYGVKIDTMRAVYSGGRISGFKALESR